MGNERQLTRVGGQADLLLDVAWRALARAAMDELEAAMEEWQAQTFRIGELLRKIEVHSYYRIDDYDSFSDCLSGHGWNRRRCNHMARIYDVLHSAGKLSAADVQGIDLDLMLEAKNAITPERSTKIVESARDVAERRMPVEEFRKLWVEPNFGKEPTAGAKGGQASTRSKVAETVEGMMGWTPTQVVECMMLLAKSLERQTMLGPEELATLSAALEPSARLEFVRQLFTTTDFFDEAVIRLVIRSGIRALGQGSVGKIADDFEKALAAA